MRSWRTLDSPGRSWLGAAVLVAVTSACHRDGSGPLLSHFFGAYSDSLERLALTALANDSKCRAWTVLLGRRTSPPATWENGSVPGGKNVLVIESCREDGSWGVVYDSTRDAEIPWQFRTEIYDSRLQ